MGLRKEALEMVGLSPQEAESKEHTAKSAKGVFGADGIGEMVKMRMQGVLTGHAIGQQLDERDKEPHDVVTHKHETTVSHRVAKGKTPADYGG